MGGASSHDFSSEKETMFIHYGDFKTQGERSYMEDDYRVFLDYGDQFRTIKDHSHMSPDAKFMDKEYPAFLCVFDGHSGGECVKYVREHLFKKIRTSPHYPQDLTLSLTEAFSHIDREFMQNIAAPDGLEDGSTATLSIIWNDQITIAHAGDCRAIVYDDGDFIQLTDDHLPSTEIERERIERHGGSVRNDRIKGRLGVSRCFGAYPYKNKDTFEERYCSSVPDIITFKISKDTEFLVLATDGIFSKVSNEELLDIIKDRLLARQSSSFYKEDKRRYIYEICIDVCKEAHDKGATDNMTLLIVTFDHKEDIPKYHEVNDDSESSETADADVLTV
eukprot:TRINITY_DN7646_c0_g1_i1.p1 TRINITY_DN7646_c0_g1~~TRINITY_DN7646_c0_g1_i1.p1  ORF type:complete len:334 (-),score=59.01 TRINITY_DN7646_c0_g1_i1:28-1029(-)